MVVPGLQWSNSCNKATNCRLVCSFHLQPSLGSILSVLSGQLQETARTVGERRQCVPSSFRWCIQQLCVSMGPKRSLAHRGLDKNKANFQMTLRFMDMEETFLSAFTVLYISCGLFGF